MFMELPKLWNLCYIGYTSQQTAYSSRSSPQENLTPGIPPPTHIKTPVPTRRTIHESITRTNLGQPPPIPFPDIKPELSINEQTSCRSGSITRLSKHEHFKNALRIMDKLMSHITTKYNAPEILLNTKICDKERTMIIDVGLTINDIPDYFHLGIQNIYSVLLYIYYSLTLLEHTWDYLKMSDLKRILPGIKYELAVKLIYTITAEDMIINKINVSSNIRRSFMGMSKLETSH